MDVADLIWNRAALKKGGASPGVGDRALNRHAGVSRAGDEWRACWMPWSGHLQRTRPGSGWPSGGSGLESVDHLLASVRRDIEAGALGELDRAEALELATDRDYQAIVPSDEALATAFRRRLDDDPGAFARL